MTDYYQKDIRKSAFPAITDAVDTDFFDLVRGSQNLKISLANLINSLGTTGSLESLGDAAATPILKQVGSVNQIRTAIGGSGITTGLTVADGLEIKHNFNVDKTGAPIMNNETAVQPTLRSLVAGTGITVGASGDTIQIATSGTPGSTKTIQVFQESDFPTAVGGVITLAGDTEYRLQNDVSTASRFVLGSGTLLSGADNTIVTLNYTGANNMITVLDNNFKIKDINLSCPLATLFSISSTTGDNQFQAVFFTANCANVGTIDNYAVCIFEFCTIEVSGQGFIFTNDFGLMRFGSIGIIMPSGAGNAINLGTATFVNISLENTFFDVSSTGYCIAGAAASANIATGGLGVLTRSTQFGTSTLLNGISPYDDFWEMVENADILNSTNLILTINTGTTIAIAAAATPVLIGPAWVPQEVHRFTGNASGRATYTGKGAHLNFAASISVDLVSGIDDISFFLYKNGVQIAGSKTTREVDSGDIGNITLLWADEAATNDYYELWVQNDDTNIDVIISTVTLRID